MIRRWAGAATLRVAWWALAALGVLVLLAGAMWLVLKLPQTLYSYVPDPKDRAGAEATTRTGLIAALAGLAALGSLAVTARTYRLSLQGQLTDRYTKAVAQLGDDKLDIRLGGIYALERLAADSKRDHPTVVEVLSAYIRERTRATTRARPLGRRTAHPLRLINTPRRVTVDIQAALTVLGRLPARSGLSRADLSGANLAGAHLAGADLTKANLRGANLTGAYLYRADLAEADLYRANLTEANLYWANLTRTYLNRANLTQAFLDRANLTQAHLNWANLTRTYLNWANLTQTYLDRANLTRARLEWAALIDAWLVGADLTEAELGWAKLTKAHLGGANLAKAVGLKQEQIDSARSNEDTLLPDGLTRPDAWASTGPPDLLL
ncbi:MAG: pentapeptide repeat-containing protein [Actinobacteria bacterium]|nr:pentapeptide repeat-containing protein [Actinomycetota bacterium]